MEGVKNPLRGQDFEAWMRSPSPFLGRTVFLPVLVEFLVGNSGTAGKRLLGSLETKLFLQFLITDVCRILIGHAPLGKRLGGDGKCELAVLRLRDEHAVVVISAPGSVFKSKILNLHRHSPHGRAPTPAPLCSSKRGRGAWFGF